MSSVYHSIQDKALGSLHVPALEVLPVSLIEK